jgi:hypothetical protein
VEWASNQPTIVDCPHLIHQQVRIPGEFTRRGYAHLERFGIVHQFSREWNDVGRWMLCKACACKTRTGRVLPGFVPCGGLRSASLISPRSGIRISLDRGEFGVDLMLSSRTRRETSASRSARKRADVLRFMRRTAIR